MNSIDNIKLIDIAKILFIYLGGVYNIKSISHCSSRLRLEVNDQELVATDNLILSLQNRGVSRIENNIQIIWNNHVAILHEALKEIHDVFKDKISQNIILLTNNHIETYFQTKNIITLELSTEIKLDQKFLDHLSRLNCIVQKKFNILCIAVPDEYNIEQLTKTLNYWDLIQSYAIVDIVDVHNIKRIVYQKSLYRIILKNFEAVAIDVWKPFGLPEVYNDTKESEIQFTYHSKQLISLIKAHISLETNKN
ncbi:MAG: PTS transporter subunit EIIB [Brevinema sp.]